MQKAPMPANEHARLELLPFFNRALGGERAMYDNIRYGFQQDRIWSATYIPDIRAGKVAGFYVMSQDITERKRAENALLADARHNSRTGLPNRRALYEALAHAIDLARNERVPFALFFLDLDGFKAVNDNYGYDSGDALLVQAGSRLKTVVRQGDFVSRLAGDEFIVLSRGIANAPACSRIAQDVCRTLARPFLIDGKHVEISVSVGVTLCGSGDDPSVDDVISRAYEAMYEPKRKGRNGFRFATCSVAKKHS